MPEPTEQLREVGHGGQGGRLPDLSALGLGAPGAAGGGFDLNALMGQFQAMMQPHDGTVNWNLARDTARRVTAAASDPSVTTTEDGQPAVSTVVVQKYNGKGYDTVESFE